MTWAMAELPLPPPRPSCGPSSSPARWSSPHDTNGLQVLVLQTCEAGPKGSPGDAEPVLPHRALPRGSGERDRPEARGPEAASVRRGVAGGGSPGLFVLLPLGPEWAGELGGRQRGGPQTTALSPSCALLVILAKYGLDGRKDARAVSSNSISHGPADHSLEDPRLEKLWHKVPSRYRPPWRRQALAFGFLPLRPLAKGGEGRELGLSTPPGSKGPAWPAGVIHRGTRVANPRWAWRAGCTPKRGQVGSAYGGTPRRGQVSTAHGGVHWGWLSFQAKTSGKFSSEELDKLWRELQHHKEKVHEYNVLLETLSRTEGAPAGGPGSRTFQNRAAGGLGAVPCCQASLLSEQESRRLGARRGAHARL